VRTGLIAVASRIGAKPGLAGVVPESMLAMVLFSTFCHCSRVASA
jgi:hypothetical protein